MKERVEDLGRIREKLVVILESEIFESSRMHDEAFLTRFKDEEHMQLRCLSDNLWDCLAIARGEMTRNAVSRKFRTTEIAIKPERRLVVPDPKHAVTRIRLVHDR